MDVIDSGTASKLEIRKIKTAKRRTKRWLKYAVPENSREEQD